MIFVFGYFAGVATVLAVIAAFVAPDHWELWQDHKQLKKDYWELGEERDHYRNLVGPRTFGSVDEYVDGKPVKERIYDSVTIVAGTVEHHIDDIRDGGT